MKTVKIKGNQYAELVANLTEDGEPLYLATESRLNVTHFGELFMALMREAMRSGKFDSPIKLVDFCAAAATHAVEVLSWEPAFAIEAPPRSAINRKVAKAKAQKDTDNA